MDSQEEVTLLLNRMAGGDSSAGAVLWSAVYEELRRLASHYLQAEAVSHTLQPTALVNEAYLRLTGRRAGEWENRTQFLGVAARAMRRILIDHARRRSAAKRGGREAQVTLPDYGLAAGGPQRDEDLIALDEALERLSDFDADLARLVELRFFAGMTFEESARTLGISTITAKRMWKLAKGWLQQQIRRED